MKGVSRVLVANRGEIAVRVIRACRALGIEAVVAVSAADRDSLPARLADRAVCIGPAPAARSYLDVRAVVTAALGTGCDAVHPGYGFLAEAPELAETCAAHGLTFVGPRPETLRRVGNKLQARAEARSLGVPVLPGSERVAGPEEAGVAAEAVGWPLLVKAAAGGGGRGMKRVARPEDLSAALESAAAEARAAFGDASLYLERYVPRARHVEVQILGDRHGHVIHLGERDCSLQRRHQKLVEEAPAPDLAPGLRQALREAALAVARGLRYEGAGTVEFLVDPDEQRFYFLEVNARIQVEHPVTEMVAGVDLVQAQLRLAAGEPLRLSQGDVVLRGHAIECRVNAEAPWDGFRPCPGRIAAWRPPEGDGVRVDSHCHAGYTVPPYYDSLLAKLVVHGGDRAEALERTRGALEAFQVSGVETTLPFLRVLVGRPEFRSAHVSTTWVEQILEECLPGRRSAGRSGEGGCR